MTTAENLAILFGAEPFLYWLRRVNAECVAYTAGVDDSFDFDFPDGSHLQVANGEAVAS